MFLKYFHQRFIAISHVLFTEVHDSVFTMSVRRFLSFENLLPVLKVWAGTECCAPLSVVLLSKLLIYPYKLPWLSFFLKKKTRILGFLPDPLICGRYREQFAPPCRALHRAAGELDESLINPQKLMLHPGSNRSCCVEPCAGHGSNVGCWRSCSQAGGSACLAWLLKLY